MYYGISSSFYGHQWIKKGGQDDDWIQGRLMRFLLLEELLAAFLRAEKVLSALIDFFDGIFLGKIGVAHLVLDHET